MTLKYRLLLCLAVAAALPLSAERRTVSPPDAEEGAPGFRYQLAQTLTPGLTPHVIKFVLVDGAGRQVVTDTFTGTLKKQLVSPIFILFRDDSSAYTAARERARSLSVQLDGKEVDHLSFGDLERRAANLMVKGLRAPFVNPPPRLTRGTSPSAASVSGGFARKFVPTTETETWEGCQDDEYCYDQWNYCNENCAPWDPYLPCQDCNSNLSACTGGIETNSWSENTIASYSLIEYECKAPENHDIYGLYTIHVHHQEFQAWYCNEADGAHYFTINTVDSYFDQYCYSLVYPNYPLCTIYPPVSVLGCLF